MGRTGRRAGQVANTTFFCETDEGVLRAIALVELARARWVEAVELTDRAWPVLVHQLPRAGPRARRSVLGPMTRRPLALRRPPSRRAACTMT
ncbi:MAG: hypothetical protein IPK80_28995 [Nannocystis sp.]|nr:hypothetical protein [Nannocystis sp.]